MWRFMFEACAHGNARHSASLGLGRRCEPIIPCVGKEGPAFIRTIGLWWGDLMTSSAELAAERLD